MIKKQTIYVAGPMRGYEEFNYPAFYEAERILESIGWDVVNPAKMDAEELDKKEGVDPLTFDPHKSTVDQETLRHLLSRDLEAVAKKCTVGKRVEAHLQNGNLQELSESRFIMNPDTLTFDRGYLTINIFHHEDKCNHTNT